MQTLDQQIYVIIKQYAIKKRDGPHSIAGLFIPDSTAQACIHNIIETIKKAPGEPGAKGEKDGQSNDS